MRPEPTTWPVVKFAIAPAELLRLNLAMKDKRFRRRADTLRAVVNEGLKAMGY